jgi:hypothetical protein
MPDAEKHLAILLDAILRYHDDVDNWKLALKRI